MCNTQGVLVGLLTNIDLGAHWGGARSCEGGVQELDMSGLLTSQLSSICSDVAGKVGLGAA